jgi:formate hydrogenlyase subunit 6/NADH:ubiquinone oxidoreductase subunit I
MAYFTMAKLALKWALKNPPTQNYPFTPRRIVPKTRGQLVFLRDTCTFCGVCGKKCPTRAIAVSRKPTQKWTIDRLLCITCGYCVDVCPKDSLSLSTSHGLPAVTKDKEIH